MKLLRSETGEGSATAQAAILAACAMALACAGNAAHPRGLSWRARPEHPRAAAARAEGVRALSVDAARVWLAEGALALDARSAAEWRAGHVPQAISLPWGAFDRMAPAVEPLLLPPAPPILVYGVDAGADEAILLALEVRRRWGARAAWLEEGWDGWRRAGAPTARAEDAP
jgi:rhodanese-related sulfurtransferase